MLDCATTAEAEVITAVDKDGATYPIGKMDAHVRNVPHLAVSVFVFSGNRLLMQQRADCKYHSGGLWANTCCSHPRWNESLADCASRRLEEEVGARVDLELFGRIDYKARVGSELFENEHAHCYVGRVDENALETHLNPEEVQAIAWFELPELKRQIEQSPERFAEWIRIYISQHYDLIAGSIES